MTYDFIYFFFAKPNFLSRLSREMKSRDDTRSRRLTFFRDETVSLPALSKINWAKNYKGIFPTVF